MEKTNLIKDDIRNLIIYGLSENNVNVNSIDPKRIDIVIEDFYFYCDDFKTKYVQGELDTFKKAACLLVAISKNDLVFDKKLNAYIAIDASEKMCEKPYWNIGPNYDIPHKLEEVDFKKLFESDKYCYDKHRRMLTDAILYADKNIEPISVYLNLELFYRVAVELKKEQTKASINNMNNLSTHAIKEESNFEYTNNTETPTPKKKRKLFSLFRK